MADCAVVVFVVVHSEAQQALVTKPLGALALSGIWPMAKLAFGTRWTWCIGLGHQR
jgi:hypothetical protein